jgi:hypothetical protein
MLNLFGYNVGPLLIDKFFFLYNVDYLGDGNLN